MSNQDNTSGLDLLWEKLTIILDVSQPEDIGNGAWKTRLTHHSLDGELVLIHSSSGSARGCLLRDLDSNPLRSLKELVSFAGEAYERVRNTSTG